MMAFNIFKKRGSKAKLDITKETEFGEIREISSPTSFKHEWHVGYNQESGEFVGLPPAWDMWLQSSNISKKEQTSNPNAVINALKTYEKSMRDKNHNKYLGAESMEDLSEGGSQRSSKSDSEPKTPENETKPPPLPSLPKKEGMNKTMQENGVENLNNKMTKVKIAEGSKQEDRADTKKPTMRKKSVKKKKMTDEEIMSALNDAQRESSQIVMIEEEKLAVEREMLSIQKERLQVEKENLAEMKKLIAVLQSLTPKIEL